MILHKGEIEADLTELLIGDLQELVNLVRMDQELQILNLQLIEITLRLLQQVILMVTVTLSGTKMDF